jgi:putative lipoprotein
MMMNTKTRTLLIILAIVITGAFVAIWAMMAFRGPATVSGTITYRERIALPNTAVVFVRIEDVSIADVSAKIMGEQIITNPGQVPIPFEVEYDPNQIQENHTYNLRVRIEDDNGNLLFISDTHTPIITRGAPTENVEVVVVSKE